MTQYGDSSGWIVHEWRLTNGSKTMDPETAKELNEACDKQDRERMARLLPRWKKLKASGWYRYTTHNGKTRREFMEHPLDYANDENTRQEMLAAVNKSLLVNELHKHFKRHVQNDYNTVSFIHWLITLPHRTLFDACLKVLEENQ